MNNICRYLSLYALSKQKKTWVDYLWATSSVLLFCASVCRAENSVELNLEEIRANKLGKELVTEFYSDETRGYLKSGLAITCVENNAKTVSDCNQFMAHYYEFDSEKRFDKTQSVQKRVFNYSTLQFSLSDSEKENLYSVINAIYKNSDIESDYDTHVQLAYWRVRNCVENSKSGYAEPCIFLSPFFALLDTALLPYDIISQPIQKLLLKKRIRKTIVYATMLAIGIQPKGKIPYMKKFYFRSSPIIDFNYSANKSIIDILKVLSLKKSTAP